MKTQNPPFSPLRTLSLAIVIAGALSSTASATTVNIGAGTYTENFNTLAVNQEPAPGWDIRLGASDSSIGTFASRRRLLAFGAPVAWSDQGGGSRNLSSNNIPQTSDAAAQAANPNRALGFSQSFTLGNPGAAFNFNFSSTGILMDSVTIDLLLLNDVANSTTFSLGYGLGANPTSFTTLATWSDLDVAGGWGSTTFTFDRADFGSDLDDQSQAWFRVFAVTTVNQDGSAENAFDQVAVDNFSVTATAVPEPSTYALILISGVAILIIARRRQANLNA